MSTVHCLIVDDEPLAREIIRTYISGIPGWRVEQSCINALEAYEALQEYPVDVMFLDIQMPVVSGIEFLQSLKQPPYVVFTTAFTHHAVEGFELNAVDYLVKPVTYDRFRQTVAKVQERLAARTAGNAPRAKPADYCFIKQDTRLVKVDYEDILFIEAQRDFAYIYLKDKKLLASMHLKALEAMMAAPQLLRVHRSYIVNLRAIQSINGNTIAIADKEIPIGANYKAALFGALGL